nr:acyl-CoA dehydrogenase family protein [uncultured Hyphomonas sp.]
MKTTAVKDGDEWVLNGVKQFITTGREADVAIVFAVNWPPHAPSPGQATFSSA